MAELQEHGYCFGVGATNSREAHSIEGDVVQFQSVATPDDVEEFFGWMADSTLRASDAGANWAVVGVPGPVTRKDGDYFVNFTNVLNLNRSFNLAQELEGADPAVRRLREQGFQIIAANDGDLAAQAAAYRLNESKYDRVADVILGTGVGGALVGKDVEHPEVYRVVKLPFEIGHVVLGEYAQDTFENRYSGRAVEGLTGQNPETLPSDHPIWRHVGAGVGKLATLMSLVGGAELVVVSGGLGSGAADNYRAALDEFMDGYAKYGSRPQMSLVPEIVPVPKSDAQVFEMYGARGVLLDAVTPQAA